MALTGGWARNRSRLAKALRPVDIHRIADRGNRAALRRIARDGERRQAQWLGKFQQGKIVVRADRDEAGIDRFRPLRRDDADGQAIIVHRFLHHMGIGDDPLSAHGKAGAVGDREDFLPVLADNDHAHHAACRGLDIRRIGQCRSGRQRESGKQEGEKGCDAVHIARGFYIGCALTASFGTRSLHKAGISIA